jgi:hypothetical protein
MSRWPHAKMSQLQSTRSPMLYYRYLLPEASCIGRESVVQLAAWVPVWLPRPSAPYALPCAIRTFGSKWTIFSGEIEVAQSLALLTSYNTKPYLHWLSGRISLLIGQNAGGKTLILQASSPAISDTLFDSSQAQRL